MHTAGLPREPAAPAEPGRDLEVRPLYRVSQGVPDPNPDPVLSLMLSQGLAGKCMLLQSDPLASIFFVCEMGMLVPRVGFQGALGSLGVLRGL